MKRLILAVAGLLAASGTSFSADAVAETRPVHSLKKAVFVDTENVAATNFTLKVDSGAAIQIRTNETGAASYETLDERIARLGGTASPRSPTAQAAVATLFQGGTDAVARASSSMLNGVIPAVRGVYANSVLFDTPTGPVTASHLAEPRFRVRADEPDDPDVKVDLFTSCRVDWTDEAFGADEAKCGAVVFKEVKDIDLFVALNNISTYSESLQATMREGGLADDQISVALSGWLAETQGALSAGLVKYQQKVANEFAAHSTGIADAIKSAASQLNIDVAQGTAAGNSAAAAMANAVTTVKSFISGTAANIAEQRKTYESKFKALQEAVDKSTGSIADLKRVDKLVADCEKQAVELAKLMTWKEQAQSNVDKIPEFAVDMDRIKVSTDLVTNSLNRLTAWLGRSGDDEKMGHFIPPKRPNGEEYPETADINSYLGDVGVITYVDAAQQELESPPGMRYQYYISETVHDGKTNALASSGFLAPKNWAGSGIVCTDGVYRLDKPFHDATNTIITATNILYRSGGVTNVLYGGSGMLAKLFGFDVDLLTGEKVVINNTYGGITNLFTANINVSNGFDNKSVWTNGERQVEIKGFHQITGEAEDKFVPLAVNDGEDGRVVKWEKYSPAKLDAKSVWTNDAEEIEIKGFAKAEYLARGRVPVRYGGKGQDDAPYIEWETNAVPGLRKMLGVYRELTEQELSLTARALADLSNLIEPGGLFDVVIGPTGVVRRLNEAIDVIAAYDNASVWTNGEKKVEVKGFGDAEVNTVPVVTEDEGGNKGLRWSYFPGTDASSDTGMSGAEYSSLDYLHNYAGVDPGKHKNGGTNVLTIAGFPLALDLTVPTVRRDNETGARDLEWNPYYEPDSAVTGDVSPGKSLVASAVVGSDERPHTAVSLYGFDTAETNTVPTVVKDSDGNRYLEWRGLKGETDVRPFALNTDNTQMGNCYYNLGGVTYRMGDQAVPSGTGIVYLKVLLSNSDPVASVEQASDLEALNAEEREYNQYVFPLYIFGANGLEADLRSMPAAPVYMNTTR